MLFNPQDGLEMPGGGKGTPRAQYDEIDLTRRMAWFLYSQRIGLQHPTSSERFNPESSNAFPTVMKARTGRQVLALSDLFFSTTKSSISFKLVPLTSCSPIYAYKAILHNFRDII